MIHHRYEGTAVKTGIELFHYHGDVNRISGIFLVTKQHRCGVRWNRGYMMLPIWICDPRVSQEPPKYDRTAIKEDIETLSEQDLLTLAHKAQRAEILIDPYTFEPHVIIDGVRYNIETVDDIADHKPE